MSTTELDRVGVMARLVERRLTQREAACQLGLSERQVRRLAGAYETDGAEGLASRLRGRPSNRRLTDGLRVEVIELVRGLYHDFGPTLAHEKLTELHEVRLSVETLRKWMIAAGLWTPRAQRDRRVHQPRRRRACLGELVQIDGCDHDWFEERAPRCVLLVFIDDATGLLMELRFSQAESTFSYFTSVRRYLERHGRPVAFYSDKANIFRVNRKDHHGSGLTQFGRAMTDLNIDIICANTPSAKGRVERAHLTLQDRLVKELRLAGVSSIEEGNAFLDGGYMAAFNDKFGREPHSPHDAHRPLLPNEPLDDIFRWQEDRKVSRSLTLNYQRVLYVLEPSDEARAARGNLVRIYEDDDGNVSIRHGAVELAARAFPKEGPGVTQGDVVDNKLLAGALEHIRQQQQARERDRLETVRTQRERRIIRQNLHPG